MFYTRLLLALGACIFISNLSAQSVADTAIYIMAEQMPKYPGGNDSLLREIAANVDYPVQCQDSGIQGKVYLKFVVNTDGSIADVHAVKSPHPLLSAAAIEATKGLKKFAAGIQQGKPVRVWYSVPVSFKVKTFENVEEMLNQKNPGLTDTLQTLVAELERDTVFKFVEVMPEFPGGDKALLQFLADHTVYPKKELENDIDGKVLLRFVVNEVGKVEDVAVVNGISPGLDREAVRVVSLFPNFKPATQQGKPVKVYYNLPFMFKLGYNNGFEGNSRKNLYDYFPGGFAAFCEATQSHLIYPAKAQSQKLQAKLSVKCLLSDNLHLIPIEVFNDIDSIFTSEAIRLIELAKPFNPEIRQSSLVGQPVKIVIEFVLDKRHRYNGSGGPDYSAANGYVHEGADKFKDGKYEKAIELFDAAIRYYSVHPDAYYNRALTRYKINDIKGACDDFKQAYLLGALDAKKV